MWWAADGAVPAQIVLYPPADVALMRFDDPSVFNVTEFPTFRRSADILQGTSLVRIGYPFTSIKVQWDDTAKQFKFESGQLPLFAIEGMLSRMQKHTPPDPSVDYPLHFYETSSPGLRGQSGGPILDSNARVCAMQSRTVSYPLGFRPELAVGGQKFVEHQILNVGLGTSTLTLEALFDRHAIKVEWVD